MGLATAVSRRNLFKSMKQELDYSVNHELYSQQYVSGTTLNLREALEENGDHEANVAATMPVSSKLKIVTLENNSLEDNGLFCSTKKHED